MGPCRKRWMPGLLVLIGTAAYANSLTAPFIFDDHQRILDDPTIETLWPAWDVMTGSSRPLTKWSLAVNFAMGGRAVAGYHLANIAIHILAALALFGVVRRTIKASVDMADVESFADRIALGTAALWIAHPLQSQAVTYTIQRAESLMGLFYLLTLYCAVRSAHPNASRWWSLAAVGSCAMGMGSKEVMVTAPLAVLLHDRTFSASSLLRALTRRPWLYAGLAATWGVLFGVVGVQRLFSASTAAGFGLASISPLQYALSQPAVILHYLRLALWPSPLCLDYGWTVADDAWQVLIPITLLVPMLALAVWQLVRRHWLGFTTFSFFLVLAPTSSAMPIADLAFEHRMYLPLAAWVLIAVVAIDRFAARLGRWSPSAAWLLTAACVVALLAATRSRNEQYCSPLALWQSVVQTAPENPRGHYNLAFQFQQSGRLDRAVEHYLQAIALDDQFADAHNNLANCYQKKQQWHDAIGHYQTALAINPRSADVHNNLGVALRSLGKPDEAIKHFRRALRLDPQHATAKANLETTASP